MAGNVEFVRGKPSDKAALLQVKHVCSSHRRRAQLFDWIRLDGFRSIQVFAQLVYNNTDEDILRK